MQHAVADYLSRLESGEPTIGVRDDFPNAQLFRIDAWISEMTVFPKTRLTPKAMSLDEWKRMVVRSRNFSLLKGTLYHKGADGIWQRAMYTNSRNPLFSGKHTMASQVNVMAGHYNLKNME